MSGIGAFVGGKCPQCRKGKVFKYPITRISEFKQINETCPNCNVKYESEPGFFWGAMYFSYAINVAMFIVVGALFFSLSKEQNLGVLFGIFVVLALALSPLTFRISRMLMMYIAAPYRKYKKRKGE